MDSKEKISALQQLSLNYENWKFAEFSNYSDFVTLRGQFYQFVYYLNSGLYQFFINDELEESGEAQTPRDLNEALSISDTLVSDFMDDPNPEEVSDSFMKSVNKIVDSTTISPDFYKRIFDAEDEFISYMNQSKFKASYSGDNTYKISNNGTIVATVYFGRGGAIDKVSVVRGITTPEERKELYTTLCGFQGKAQGVIIQEEQDALFRDLFSDINSAKQNGNKLQFSVGYKHLSVNVIETKEGYDYSVGTYNSPSVEANISGHADSVNDLVKGLIDGIKEINSK